MRSLIKRPLWRDYMLVCLPVLAVAYTHLWWRILSLAVFWVCLGVRDALKKNAEVDECRCP